MCHPCSDMVSNTASSTITSALRGFNDYFMTALELKVQGVRMRQTPGSWFWGGEITCWVSYQWAYCPICVLQASSRRRDSLEFRHGRDRRVLREVHDGCRRLAQPRRAVLGASYGESFPRCPSELLQACILKRARATTCGDKPAPAPGNSVFGWRTVEIPTTHCRYRIPTTHCRSRIPTTHCRYLRVPQKELLCIFLGFLVTTRVRNPNHTL